MGGGTAANMGKADRIAICPGGTNLIYSASHRYLAQHSIAFRRVIFSLTSEQWSCLGFGALVLTVPAGYFRHPYLYGILLLVQELCDLNDGYVYQLKENGVPNGYGLYIDHILDSIGACFVTVGGYLLLGVAPFACALGLVLYYLIAIHSWLYKINKISAGQLSGSYYGIAVRSDKRFWLSVDELTVAMTIIAIWRSVFLLYVTDIALLIVFLTKVVRATFELRTKRWLSGDDPPDRSQRDKSVHSNGSDRAL